MTGLSHPESGYSWGSLRDAPAFQSFLAIHLPDDCPPEIDFSREMILFLVPGPTEGRYGRYRFYAYREEPDGGIIVICRKGRDEGEVQLARVPRFEGQVIFCFGELP